MFYEISAPMTGESREGVHLRESRESMAKLEREIESAALQMPRSSRARLAEMLLVSLDEEDEIEAAWGEEIERRIREIDAGEVVLVPGEQVMAELRSLLT